MDPILLFVGLGCAPDLAACVLDLFWQSRICFDGGHSVNEHDNAIDVVSDELAAIRGLPHGDERASRLQQLAQGPALRLLVLQYPELAFRILALKRG